MKILHLLSIGTIGGIEVLCRDIAEHNNVDNVFAFLFGGGPIETQIESAGATVYKLYTIHKLNIRKFLNKLSEVCREEKIDIVIVHHEGISVLIYYLLLQRRAAGVKFIRYIHSVFEKDFYFDSNFVLNALNKRLMKLSFAKSDQIIAVSQCVKKSFEDHFTIPEGKIKVIYNGISRQAGEGSKLCQRETQDVIEIVYLGRLVAVKGIDILLRAFAKLLQVRQNVLLRIIGDGDARAACEALTDELAIRGNVCFEGLQLEKEAYLQKADIFVCPSKCQEAFGISIIEAMSYGMTCIASKVGGIPEIIRDGENGFLFTSENSIELYEKLRNAIQLIEEGGNQAMAAAAVETAGKFTIENTIMQLNETYEAICR